jgi:UDP-N-acetylmuramate--alanine ligase
MFLGLAPEIAVVTNIEYDHPDCFPTPEDFYQAFQEFVSRLVPAGTLVACVDDLRARRLLDQATRTGRGAAGYGLQGLAGETGRAYRAQIHPANSHTGRSWDVYRGGKLLVNIHLQVPGEHNLKNALAALAVADLLQLPIPQATLALSEFQGTGRRFDVRGESQGVVVIDDYAHHPTEIRTTLAAVRDQYPEQEIWAVWQPHTYSRTIALEDDFVTTIAEADLVIVTGIYASREKEQAYSVEKLVQRIDQVPSIHITSLSGVTEYLAQNLQPEDVLIVLSAGDADRVCHEVMKAMKERKG